MRISFRCVLLREKTKVRFLVLTCGNTSDGREVKREESAKTRSGQDVTGMLVSGHKRGNTAPTVRGRTGIIRRTPDKPSRTLPPLAGRWRWRCRRHAVAPLFGEPHEPAGKSRVQPGGSSLLRIQATRSRTRSQPLQVPPQALLLGIRGRPNALHPVARLRSRPPDAVAAGRGEQRPLGFPCHGRIARLLLLGRPALAGVPRLGSLPPSRAAV
jgi:hypothetical protein